MTKRPLFFPLRRDEIKHVAVMAGKPQRGNPMHCAVLFRSADSTQRVLHLVLDGSVMCETVEEANASRLVWGIPHIPDRVLEKIAAFCEHLANKNPKFNYAFRFLPTSKLVIQGESVVLSGEGYGLTCATFVLAIFQSIGFPLLELESWPPRDTDEAMQRNIIGILRRHGARWGVSPASIGKTEAEVPCLRFRPEEVLASCSVGNHPTKFDVASPAGEEVAHGVDAMYALLQA